MADRHGGYLSMDRTRLRAGRAGERASGAMRRAEAVGLGPIEPVRSRVALPPAVHLSSLVEATKLSLRSPMAWAAALARIA
ncbi:MAG: hypothetical protein NVS9B3_05380 [Gemmatimonadaceae bacterium]